MVGKVYSICMGNGANSGNKGRKRDWRIWFGIVVTTIWLGGGGLYVFGIMDAETTNQLSPEAIGSFLEGAFAPLAFLWLVIGLFIQQRELANNSKAIRKASKQSEKQTAAIAATEMNARQETFFKIKENVNHQLGGITGMLYSSSMGSVGSGDMSREETDANFKRIADGDCEVFARMFLGRSMIDHADLRDMFFGTEIRARHTHNYIRTFERLRRLGRNCDVDGIIEETLMQSAFGLLYRRMLDHTPEDDADDVITNT
ncbi:MAG: hypothetical protein ACR2QR_10580 [Woeseiaceae bacterium]